MESRFLYACGGSRDPPGLKPARPRAHPRGMPRQLQCSLLVDEPDRMVIDLFRWGLVDVGKPRLEYDFQETTLRPGMVRDVYWWSEAFPPKSIASHGQLAFLMDGLEGIDGADGRRDIGMVYSVEAHLAEGQRYDPIQGLDPRGHFGVIHMLTTLSDRVQNVARVYGHSLKEFRLLLDEPTKQELFRAAVRTASTPRPDERYHTTRKSCVTETVRLLNSVLPEERRVPMWTVPGVVANLRLAAPKVAPHYLVDLGLAEPGRAWGESAETLAFPQTAGPDHVIDVRELPSPKALKGLRELMNALATYVAAAPALRDLEAAHAALGPGDDAHRADLEAELASTRESLDEALASVVELAATYPYETVPFLLEQDRPVTPQADDLVSAVLERLGEEVREGRWAPTDDQATAMSELRKELAGR